MITTLLEKLPNGLCLYKIPFDKPFYPGQWLSSENRHYTVFNHIDSELLVIAPENKPPSSDLQVSGVPLHIDDENKPLLLLADGLAIPLLLFLVNSLRNQWGIKKLRSRIALILLGTKANFPFLPVPSRFILSGFPADSIASSQLLEDLELPARLASQADLPGCFSGSLGSLLTTLNLDDLIKENTTIVTFGSNQLLAITKKLFTDSTCKLFSVHFEHSS